MDNVVEKLGFFDFLNLIIVGMYTIVGGFIISYQFGWDVAKNVFLYLVNTTEVNALFLVLSIFSVIAVAYILGLVCHELFTIIERKTTRYFEKLMSTLFTDESCIENMKKRERYEILAKKIFDTNGISYQLKGKNAEILWEKDLGNYFFAYCIYQVQIRGLNKKLEKLRDIEGLAKSFCVSSALLLAILVVSSVFKWQSFSLPALFLVLEGVSLISIVLVFANYRKKALKNRVRMTFALFEAIYDQETKNFIKSK